MVYVVAGGSIGMTIWRRVEKGGADGTRRTDETPP
jgi:hypothetical protein